MTVIEVLRQARALLSIPGVWARGGMAFDEDGNNINVCERDAVARVCSVGALAYVASGDNAAYYDARQVLRRYVPGGGSITGYNDASDRAHEDVLDMFARAIKGETEKLYT